MFYGNLILIFLYCVTENIQVTEGLMRLAERVLVRLGLHHHSFLSALILPEDGKS